MAELEPGQTLSRYRIVDKIGEGGMGVVYRALDTRLGRHVALKVIRPDLVGSEERRRRFVRKARAGAAVAHPNITTIHEIDETGGVTFIVMEFVEGKPLRSHLQGRPLSLPETLGIAVQIAEGLARAHQSRVIHRDLKPDNVIIQPDGATKILDFGLAKLLEEGEEIPASELSRAETISDEMTRAGKVLGTAAYMSPEQAQGKPVDGRSDVFSFGITLYEMVTGARPFAAATRTDTLEKIVRAAPLPPSQLNPEIPADLERILGKCLEKNPDDRYQDTRDLVVDLRRLKRESDSQPLLRIQDTGTARLAGKGRRRSAAVTALWGSLSVVLAGALAWLAWVALGTSHLKKEIVARQITWTPTEDPVEDAAISPDGKYLAYLSTSGLYLLGIDTSESRRITSPAGVVLRPRGWYPDGTKLIATGYAENNDPSIWSISVLTGAVKKLRDRAACFNVSPDGKYVAYQPNDKLNREIWIMGPGGEAPRKVFTADEGDSNFWVWLGWSPDSRRIAYLRHRLGAQGILSSIESRDLEGGSLSVILPPITHIYPGRHAAWISDGRIIFAQTEPSPRLKDANLWEIRVESETGKPIGEPRRLTDWSGSFFYRLTATADSKRLAFARWHEQIDVFVGDLKDDGKTLEEPRRLTFDERDDWPAGWTRDGKSVLFSSNRGKSEDIYQQPLDSRVAEMILSGGDHQRVPLISPDGAWILYESWPEEETGGAPWLGPKRAMRMPILGGSPEEVLVLGRGDTVRCGRLLQSRCVLGRKEGTQLVFSALDPVHGKGADLGRSPFAGEYYAHWALSPDGARVAITGYEPASEVRSRIRILDLDSGVTDEIAVQGIRNLTGLCWSADGSALYAATPSVAQGAAIVRIDLHGGTRVLWRASGGADLDQIVPSPDGQHLAFAVTTPMFSAWMMEDF